MAFLPVQTPPSAPQVLRACLGKGTELASSAESYSGLSIFMQISMSKKPQGLLFVNQEQISNKGSSTQQKPAMGRPEDKGEERKVSRAERVVRADRWPSRLLVAVGL